MYEKTARGNGHGLPAGHGQTGKQEEAAAEVAEKAGIASE